MERKRGRKSKKPVREQFEMMYYNNTMTVYEIADFYRVNKQTIYNWATQFKKEKKNGI